MDSTFYRDVTTSRGIKYSVYYAKGTDPTKPTLLFLHGYPYSSYGWRHQVAFFQPLGYGVIVPDMLGYGGTENLLTLSYTPELSSQRTSSTSSTSSQGHALLCWAMTGELSISLIRATTLIIFRGSKIVSRIANIDSERILGFACVSVSYLPPNPTTSYPQFMAYVNYAPFMNWNWASSTHVTCNRPRTLQAVSYLATGPSLLRMERTKLSWIMFVYSSSRLFVRRTYLLLSSLTHSWRPLLDSA